MRPNTEGKECAETLEDLLQLGSILCTSDKEYLKFPVYCINEDGSVTKLKTIGAAIVASDFSQIEKENPNSEFVYGKGIYFKSIL